MPLAIHRVESVQAAAKALAAGKATRFLGGGTLLVRGITSGTVAVDTLILSDGLGLDRIEVAADRVRIGAAVTMAKIAADPRLAFLTEVAQSIGGPAVRAMATVGGNLFARSPYGDFAVALLALGADVDVETSGGSETRPIETFLAGRGRHAPEIVRSVAFDLPPSGAFRFAKVIRKKPHGASVLAIAALLPIESGKVVGARVAYGAMAPTPIRARAVEAALEGKAPDAAAVAAAVAVAAEGCAPENDPQASAWYRLNVLPVHLKRLLAG